MISVTYIVVISKILLVRNLKYLPTVAVLHHTLLNVHTTIFSRYLN